MIEEPLPDMGSQLPTWWIPVRQKRAKTYTDFRNLVIKLSLTFEEIILSRKISFSPLQTIAHSSKYSTYMVHTESQLDLAQNNRLYIWKRFLGFVS